MPGGIHPPIEVILAWPAPNYDHPVTQSKLVLIMACIFGPLSLALLLARLWVRIRIQRNAGLDDWLMVVAAAPLIVTTVFYPMQTDLHSFNRHIWDVRPAMYPTQRIYLVMIDALFCVAAGLIKISILLFYRRLSSNAVSRTFYWITVSSIAFIIIYTIIFTLLPIFGCRPISAFWDQMDIYKLLNGYKFSCFNEGADMLVAAIISAVQDFITAIIPTFVYWNLRIPTKQKYALFGIFAIGYCAAVMGGLRAYYTWYAYFHTYDTTWTAWYGFLWSLLELHVGAMCANAPALKVLFRHFSQAEDSERARPRARGPESISFFHSFVSGPSRLAKLGFWKDANTQANKEVGLVSNDSVQTSEGTGSHGKVHISSACIESISVDVDLEKGNAAKESTRKLD